MATSLGLTAGIPIAICGHDHVTAAFAMNVTSPGKVFDSMGTAETLLGALPESSLTEDDFHSGLLYGCHVASGCGYWLGSLSVLGGRLSGCGHNWVNPCCLTTRLMPYWQVLGPSQPESYIFPISSAAAHHTPIR